MEGNHREARPGRRGGSGNPATRDHGPHDRRRDRARYSGQPQPRGHVQGHARDEHHIDAPQTLERKRRRRSDAHRGREHRGHDCKISIGAPEARPEQDPQRREVHRVRAGLCQPDGRRSAGAGADPGVSAHRQRSKRTVRRRSGFNATGDGTRERVRPSGHEVEVRRGTGRGVQGERRALDLSRGAVGGRHLGPSEEARRAGEFRRGRSAHRVEAVGQGFPRRRRRDRVPGRARG